MIAAKRAILESWCYTRRKGAASIQAESRPIPGNSRWCNFVAQFQGGWRHLVLYQRWCDLKFFIYTRVAWRTAYTRSNLDFVYTRSLPDSVYTRSLPDSVYTRSLPDSVYTRSLPDFVYTRWCSSIHTSVRGAASAWAADTRLSSDCDSVYAMAFEKRVSWAMALVGAGWYLQYPQR